MKKTVWFTTAAVLVVALALAIPALCQPGGPGGPGGPMMGGPGGPGGGPMGPPPGPQVTLLAADGAIYLACDGKLFAYEAKTLKKLAEATFWTAPKRPDKPAGQQPGGNAGNAPN